MEKITHVKPVLAVETYKEIAKLLVELGGESLSQVGEVMIKTLDANMVETKTEPVHYEESNSTGSPETYNAPDKCEPGVCD